MPELTSKPIVCVGEALIDLIADDADHWADIQHFIPRIGGAPANISVAVRRLGGHSRFIGCLANDGPGDWIRDRLQGAGVDLSAARTVKEGQTRLAVVTGPADQRDFVFYGDPAADTLLTPEHIEEGEIEKASAVTTGSLLLLSKPSRAALNRLLEIVRQNRIPLTFDPNPRPSTWPDPAIAQQLMMPLIQTATILKLGTNEPAILGMSVEEIRSNQPDEAVFVLTDGANGCWYWYGDAEALWVPTVCVDSVDSTGAGDAFAAALTLRFVENNGELDASDIYFANVAGALTTTVRGAMDALPTRSEIESVIEKSKEL
jgi:fructokinase